ncbi:hypothetical protein ABT187_48005 [Streptomyces sp. NPDC001817]|uniref:hypothetical protein n=1 Tax=Streptomyces sp. NPDC001817 TaxID=3154398 RepID=UPI003318C506
MTVLVMVDGGTVGAVTITVVVEVAVAVAVAGQLGRVEAADGAVARVGNVGMAGVVVGMAGVVVGMAGVVVGMAVVAVGKAVVVAVTEGNVGEFTALVGGEVVQLGDGSGGSACASAIGFPSPSTIMAIAGTPVLAFHLTMGHTSDAGLSRVRPFFS